VRDRVMNLERLADVGELTALLADRTTVAESLGF
jgi:hypothetical protein